MARKEQLIVGLDLGSNKTCALVCQPGEDGKLQVEGFGEAESKGWRKSVIVNLTMQGSARTATPPTATATGMCLRVATATEIELPGFC